MLASENSWQATDWLEASMGALCITPIGHGTLALVINDPVAAETALFGEGTPTEVGNVAGDLPHIANVTSVGYMWFEG